MTCHTVRMANGAFAVLCTRGQRHPRCRFCGKPAERQCDFPLKGRSAGKTCSANICMSCCETQPGRGAGGDTVDYCPPHARMKQQLTLDLEVPR